MAISQNYFPNPIHNLLGEGFSDPARPALFPKKKIRYQNKRQAKNLGFENFSDDEWTQHFADFKPLPENLSTPQALRYHGHQFHHYNPQIGDGRGFLYAQLQDKNTGKILDLGTKGSGRTLYSRSGDGRLTLKGAVRETLATAFLEYLGVNTSKTLSVIETGEALDRGDEPSPTRSAVLVRASHSHVRIGTFQRLAYFKEKEHMKTLVAHSLEYYYNEKENFSAPHLFKKSCEQIAKTTAQWMIHGFVHGVLNTDNINITGESFDYGPYRFLPNYNPSFTAAYFDREGLYAYGRQPQAIFWNLQRFEEALHLVHENSNDYKKGYEVFKVTFEKKTMGLFLKKMGLDRNTKNNFTDFFSSSIEFMQKSKIPFQRFFHDMKMLRRDLVSIEDCQHREFYKNPSFKDLHSQLHSFEPSSNVFDFEINPKDLLIDEIEAIWAQIDSKDDWSAFHNKIKAFSL